MDSEEIPRSAMAIFAHPDDAEFMVAGTVAKWAEAGCEVTFVLITSGNAGTHEPGYTKETIARKREEESREAARILGVENLVFLRHDDCAVAPTIELRRELVREIRKYRPEAVICGDPQAWFFNDTYINHPDHRAAGVAAVEAVFPAAEMELLWPEEGDPHKVRTVYVASTHSPNSWVDITGTIDTKIRALRAHESQVGGWDPSDMIRGWAEDAAKRGTWDPAPGSGGDSTRSRRPRYAEGFRVMRLREREKPPEP